MIGAAMATSTLYQSSPLGSPSGSPRSCLYLSRPKADWRASFTKPEPHKGSPTLPLILRHHDGVWLSSTSSTFSSNKGPSSQPRPETQSAPPKEANDDRTFLPRTKLNLNPVSKVLRCHVCQTTTKEQYFHHHLFFGMVHCDLCDLVCVDCRTFAQLTVGVSKDQSSCQHSFSFSEDPYQYLLPRLCGGDELEVCRSNKLRFLQHYINQMINVQLQEPWCTAIRQCKSRLLKFHTATPPEPSKNIELPKDSCDTNTNLLGVKDSRNGSPASSTENNEWDKSSRVEPERTPSPTTMQPKSPEKNVDDGLLLSQTYDLEHLEQAVEYVEVDKQWKLDGVKDVQSKPKKRRKVSHYKKLKGHRLTAPQRKRRPPALPEEEVNEEDESDLVMEEVALPQNGYYLMVQEAMEECPMCYTSLSPNLCSVNLKTFLFTVSCPQCSLLIFIVPDLPGGLQIVIDSKGGNAIKETKQSNHRKLRRIQPRDFFAK
ncbi:uncharacterized protein LOC135095074 isoform X2 [Scylla paramamosain]|uniref:uncharacterized protein LOC135095074 isoform X2 n=1 Tax=Scylla paramamosain TaxID=85552 RepID=UPI0030833D4C